MKLFEKMNLPNTAGLGVRGFVKLPMDIGFAWLPSFNSVGECVFFSPTSDDHFFLVLIYFINFAQKVITFAPERIAGLVHTRLMLLELLKCLFSAWDPVKIFFLGFSQVLHPPYLISARFSLCPAFHVSLSTLCLLRSTLGSACHTSSLLSNMHLCPLFTWKRICNFLLGCCGSN
jgi:hypothetical protein